MRRSWQRASLLSFLLLPACGTPPPPVVPPAPTAKVAAPAETGPDFSPVAEPRDLVLVARWARPTGGIDDVLKTFGSNVSLDKLIHEQAGDVAKILDLDGSVDAALALDPESTEDDPKPLAAFSVPLKSFEEAKALIEKDEPLTMIRPGVLRGTDHKKKKGMVCDLTAAPPSGQAARLVCGDHAKDLDGLRDWLVRGLPVTDPSPKGLSAVLRAAPFKDRYLGRLRKEATRLDDKARNMLGRQNVNDPELLAVPSVVLDEGIRFVEDLDRMELHGSFDPAGKLVTAGGSIRFAGRSSWFTQVITDRNDHPGPAPDAFWHMPKDAYSASWGRSADPRLFDGVRRVVHKAVAEALGRVPIPGADKEAVEAFFDGVPKTQGAWASASGLVPVKAKPAPKGHHDEVADAKALVTSAVGWHVWETETPAADYVTWFKQALDLYNRGVKLAKAFAAPSKHPIKAVKGAKIAKAAPAHKKDEWLELIPKITSVSSPPGWPRGTVAFDVTFPVNSEIGKLFLPRKKVTPKPDLSGPVGIVKAAKAKPRPPMGKMTVRLAIVPDGDHALMGFSADLDQLKKHLIASLSTAPRDGTLAARDDLADLKQPGETSGGFMTFDQVITKVEEAALREHPEHAADIKAMLDAMPNKGKTPIVFIGSGAGGATPSLAVDVRLQAGTLADLSALVSFFLSPHGRELLKKL